MEIKFSDGVQSALEKAAAAAGMSVDRYASLLMEEQLLRDSEASSRRAAAVDRLLEHMDSSSATSGREGRGWREFIHEGHPD